MAAPSYSDVNKKLQEKMAAMPAPAAPEDPVAAPVEAPAATAPAAPATEDGPSTLEQIGGGLASAFLQLLPQGAALATGGASALEKQRALEKEAADRAEREGKAAREMAQKIAEKEAEQGWKTLEFKLKGEEKKFNKESELRKEFTNNQVVKDTMLASSGFQKIQRAVSDKPSAANDLSIVYGFMKVLEPGNAVKEGEFANVDNARGVPEQVRGLYNRLITGERLPESQRQELLRAAANAYAGQLQVYEPFAKRYQELGDKEGLDTENIVSAFGLPTYKQVAVSRDKNILTGDLAKTRVPKGFDIESAMASPETPARTVLIKGKLHQKNSSGRWVPVN